MCNSEQSIGMQNFKFQSTSFQASLYKLHINLTTPKFMSDSSLLCCWCQRTLVLCFKYNPIKIPHNQFHRFQVVSVTSCYNNICNIKTIIKETILDYHYLVVPNHIVLICLDRIQENVHKQEKNYHSISCLRTLSLTFTFSRLSLLTIKLSLVKTICEILLYSKYTNCYSVKSGQSNIPKFKRQSKWKDKKCITITSLLSHYWSNGVSCYGYSDRFNCMFKDFFLITHYENFTGKWKGEGIQNKTKYKTTPWAEDQQ